jgi:hypothetical protein
MRTAFRLRVLPRADQTSGALYRFGTSGDDEGPADPLPFGPLPTEREDLPYRVELWNDDKTAVEQVLAVTASGSIGYAAYYAATREFPQRYVTLRHKNRIVTRWNGPAH